MQITASAERRIDAPARRLYAYIADFRQHHPNFLPPEFSDFEVECGGVGAGTVHRFRMTLGGRSTDYRVRVGEPQPGRVLIESDPALRVLTTFTVDPEPGGGSRVGIQTRWYGHGIRGPLRATAGAAHAQAHLPRRAPTPGPIRHRRARDDCAGACRPAQLTASREPMRR